MTMILSAIYSAQETHNLPVLCLEAEPGVEVCLQDDSEVYVNLNGGTRSDGRGVRGRCQLSLEEYRRFTRNELLADVQCAADVMLKTIGAYMVGSSNGTWPVGKVVDRKLRVMVHLFHTHSAVVSLSRDDKPMDDGPPTCWMSLSRFQHLVQTGSNVERLANLLLQPHTIEQ